jgi:glycosyltransferase involved in cell wall biosynthesis
LLHVSTGDAYKNVEGTLRTLAALRAGGETVVLLRAGQPLSAVQRELAAALGLAGAVHDLGRVDDQRLVELYNLADVLLFPSHYEGFGWPPLEAMACGTPVVTSETSALLEVTGDAALHASADSPPALACAVRTILDDTATRDRLAAAGQERAAHYRWSDTADAYSAVYHQLLDSDRRRTGGDYISAG